MVQTKWIQKYQKEVSQTTATYSVNILGQNNPLLSPTNAIGSKKGALSNIKKHNNNIEVAQ